MNKIVLYIFILLINVAFGQDKRLEKIDSVVTSWYTNNEFNGNILIAEKGNIIYNKSYGKANEETGEMHPLRNISWMIHSNLNLPFCSLPSHTYK